MNYNSICPVCQKSEQLNSFKWGIYNIIHCLNCRLDYCGEMDEKEKDGDSSPVHMPGITMMANMFYKTQYIFSLRITILTFVLLRKVYF